MRRLALAVLCLICILGGTAEGQTPAIEPLHAQLGSVLTFHLQTRLNPADKNEFDVLPKGTILRVKMLNTVDSSVDRDGAKFRGTIVDTVATGDAVLLHPESEVQGILVLLRSRNHPEGFRYELLLTSVSDHGKKYAVTASLNPSFFDTPPAAPPAPKPETLDGTPTNTATDGKFSATSPK